MLAALLARSDVGSQAAEIVAHMVSDTSLYPFLSPSVGGMAVDQYRFLIQAAREEMQRPELKLYLNL
jgi:hypothetical protein